MNLRFVFLLLCFLLTSCATFLPKHEEFITPAIRLQSNALSNPLFAEILMELNSNGDVIWVDRLRDGARKEASSFENEMVWFLSKYEFSGGLKREVLKPWRKWWPPLSPTTAAYNNHSGIVKLNLNRFNKDVFALANTFVHEKNHGFGLIHDKSQTRNSNKCDAGYLAGDLAEALLRSSAGNNGKTPHVPTCPALCSALEARGLWSACQISP